MNTSVNMQVVAEIDVKAKIGQCRTAPVNLGDGQKAVVATWCADFDVDPYIEMFFFPTDTLKMTMFTTDGEILWQRDLGKAVVPGMWFCPILPLDLDGDGTDEIWFVNNTDPNHPLATAGYVMEQVDAKTGKTIAQWPWPRTMRWQTLSHTFRNFLIGGKVKGKPILVTAQGTYGDMHLQGHMLDGNGELEEKWTYHIRKDAPGARGSHRCPVVDIDGDGSDELMWGERCIRLDDGTEMFCCDRDSYKGHSDVIQPVWLYDQQKWLIYTCRESDPKAAPRVACYDDKGNRIWGDVDLGHMDMGGTMRTAPDGKYTAMAIRIGHKTCGPDGRFHMDMTEFNYDLLTGKPVELPFSTYMTNVVDVNGDGFHEIFKTYHGSHAELLDINGNVLAKLTENATMFCKFTDLPGEQILTFTPEGKIQIWADTNAVDSPRAMERYNHPYYAPNSKLTSSGSNSWIMGGI